MVTSTEQEKPLKEFNFPNEVVESPRFKTLPTEYIIDPGLHRAVEVAMMLKQPLLLTGEPGTGKTRLAEKLAADLYAQYPGKYLSRPLVFHTKTVSSYTDLFYFYDALSHFHDAHIPAVQIKAGEISPAPGAGPRVESYIHLQALGQAIVLSNAETASRNLSYQMMNSLEEEPLFKHGIRTASSVVLIDEVDKAPRDFANDLLNELDRYEFFVKEDFNRKFEKGTSEDIFIILTSNSEKNLPEAFLRRCIFYHIEFPKHLQLTEIVMSQLFRKEEHNPTLRDNVGKYVTFFEAVRDSTADKKPATAELISWVRYLKQHVVEGQLIKEIPTQRLYSSFSILAKDKSDLLRLRDMNII
jgi:MoxR-like ATPase